jgi:hypothetical protein
VTLTVDKFGLDSLASGLIEKVHSARGLHATRGGVAKLSKLRKGIEGVKRFTPPGVPREPTPGERLCT